MVARLEMAALTVLCHLQVNWDEEKQCFQTLANELGLFYGIQRDPFLLDSSEEEQRAEGTREDANGERGRDREKKEGETGASGDDKEVVAATDEQVSIQYA